MFDLLLEKLKKIAEERYIPIIAIYALLFSILIVRIFNLQIVQNDNLFTDEEKATKKTRELKSTRGNILDCKGVLLAYNELSYSVTLEDTGELSKNADKNEMIYRLVTIIKKYGGQLANDFFIKCDENGELYFDGDTKEEYRFKRDAYSLRSVNDLTEKQKEADAQEVFEYLKEGKGSKTTSVFGISDEYEVEDALNIMQIRYYMMLNKFEKYMPITVATNVNQKTVAAINEYSSTLPGVEVLTETYRVYSSSDVYAHMMGYTGLISNDKLTELIESGDKNYSATDQIGKIGLESELEQYLHGKKGSKTIKVNSDSETEEVTNIVEPVAGDDVYLTIDSSLQEASYTLLEKELASILLSKIVNQKETGPFDSASDITIPIYDVYYALIDNNIVDITKFDDDTAKKYEVSAYKKYLNTRTSDFSKVLSEISVNSTSNASSLSDEMNEYIDRIYEIISEDGILLSSKIDKDDSYYKNYKDGTVGFSEFIQYAFEKGWIKTDKLSVEKDSFYSTKELYGKLLEYLTTRIEKDKQMSKYVYKAMIDSYNLTGTEICIILMEQGVLTYDEATVNKLASGSIAPYTFIMDKIRSGELTAGQLALDPCSGSVVVTDVKTGDVLAMVTYPSYDNNQLANSINSNYYSKLLEDKGDVLVNRATQTKTAPGSTYKMVTTAAGLEEGVIYPGFKITDEVTFTKIGNPPSCYNKHGHGTIDVIQAIGVSCNYFFYEVGFKLGSVKGEYDSDTGLATLRKYASMFGFDAKSGVEISEYEPNISDTDAVRSAIGQGTNAYSPVQIARYATSLANNGTVYNLTLIDKIVDVNGNVVLDNHASVYNNVNLKSSTWDCIHQGMHTVIYGGSSSVKKLFSNMGDIVVAGKTGTAQQVKTRPSHALFVSYAPYEAPEISVTAVIQFGYGSYNAADLASQIYQYYYELTDTDILIDSQATESDAGTAPQD